MQQFSEGFPTFSSSLIESDLFILYNALPEFRGAVVLTSCLSHVSPEKTGQSDAASTLVMQKPLAGTFAQKHTLNT